MKKLALDMDSLRVESFDTTSGHPSQRGTVQGNSLWEPLDADAQIRLQTLDYRCTTDDTRGGTVGPFPTAGASCRTCYDPSCNGTCALICIRF